MYRSVAATLFAFALCLVFIGQSAHAEGRTHLGYGRLITNDYIGDGQDRWRSGSWTSSRVWGSEWNGQAPTSFGDVIELRLSAEIFAPDNLNRAAAGDRPYAGALSVGAHTHFTWQGFEAALGADLVMTGSGTGLGNFQRGLHKVLGVELPSDATLDNQISGGFHPTVVGELARDLTLAPGVYARPFLEGRAGAETMLRGGVDLTFGRIGRGTLSVREGVTGQRYRVVPANDPITGFSFLLGADVAHVADSIFLPEDRGYTLTDSRERVRAGVHWQGKDASAFYGLTYLGEEFDAQTEGQIVGSIRINLSF
ncbi:lipid A-modifier LpxR family protein [uncultured Sulfitobacter sp.]|uniref:lipid A-modifier LpxR family protein n=1 Tax=uncultured Sulfitobacter sp. TaxID=191468 RepID=UPI00261404AB|nr:lipid A-modifier LpxR family protein [uncultured Sulfitobacter sp.]